MTVARGGKRGKTSGRGTKGQKSRSGHKIRPEIRDIIKRIPKMRGRGKNSNLSIQMRPIAVNLEALEAVFSNGDTVTREALLEKGVISRQGGKIPLLKILALGDVTKKLTIKNIPISASAKAKLVKAGGSVSNE